MDPNKAVVIKIGSQVVKKLFDDRQSEFWQQLRLLCRNGYLPVIVCSGAVALGLQVVQSMALKRATLAKSSNELNKAKPEKDLPDINRGQFYPLANKAMLASIGQGELITMWRTHLDRPVAQILVEQAHFNERHCYNELSATLNQLLKHQIVPIINQNDVLAESKSLISNNDRLAAYVTNMLGAKWLFMLTEVGGIYSDYPDCKHLVSVYDMDESDFSQDNILSNERSGMGTGGMKEKLNAALMALKQGASCFICDEKAALFSSIESGASCGTAIRYSSQPVKRLKHWMLNTAESTSQIIVDSGAALALRYRNASLLMSGIVGVSGTFARQSIVEVKEQSTGDVIAKGMVRLDSSQILMCLATQQSQVDSSAVNPTDKASAFTSSSDSTEAFQATDTNSLLDPDGKRLLKRSSIVLHRNQCVLL